MTTIAPIPPTLVTCVDHRETPQAHTYTHISAGRASRSNPLALLPPASIDALCPPLPHGVAAAEPILHFQCTSRRQGPRSGLEWMTTDARTSASIMVQANLAGWHPSTGVYYVPTCFYVQAGVLLARSLTRKQKAEKPQLPSPKVTRGAGLGQLSLGVSASPASRHQRRIRFPAHSPARPSATAY